MKTIKKIYDFYATVAKNATVPFIMMFFISALVGTGIENKLGLIWGILGGLTMLTLFVWNVHKDWSLHIKHKEMLNKKYGDDPDWKTYNELKKKFNNQ